MVKFFKIPGVSAFGMFFPFSRIAPLKTYFRMFIFQFYIIPQVEELLYACIEKFLKVFFQSMVFDGNKANVMESLSQFLHKFCSFFLISGSKVSQVQGRDVVI